MPTITRPADLLITLCQLEEQYQDKSDDAGDQWRKTNGTDRTYWAGAHDAYEELISDIQGLKEEVNRWLKRSTGKN